MATKKPKAKKKVKRAGFGGTGRTRKLFSRGRKILEAVATKTIRKGETFRIKV